MKRPLTVGYITVDDPHDRRTWSGTNFFLMKALEQQCTRVVPLGPLRPQPWLLLCRALNQLSLVFLRKRFNYRDSFIMSRAYARVIRRRMKAQDIDLLIAPAGLGTIALLRTDLPIIYFNDRCLAGALGYHPILTDLLACSCREGLALERNALDRALLTVYSSDWAADAAKAHYPDRAHTVRTIPMGINLDQPPASPMERPFPDGPVKLLFLGVKWVEKGGPIAYETLLALKRRGIRAQLVVCGCEPPADLDDPDLVREGFLNKNIPAQQQRLTDHLRTAHLLILPTRFDASPIVTGEAAAYGLPVLATRTGGVPTLVLEGITGHLFGMEEGGEAYAERIATWLEDPAQWLAMRKAARQRFEDTLNWPAFVQTLLGHFLASSPSRSSR